MTTSCDKKTTMPNAPVMRNAYTYFGGEDIEVNQKDLLLIPKNYLVLNVMPLGLTHQPFTEDIPKGYVAAYKGSFGEYVPVVLEQPENRYISIYGFKTEDDLDNNNETHIDSITEDDTWEDCAASIVADNKGKYFHITVENDEGKSFPV